MRFHNQTNYFSWKITVELNLGNFQETNIIGQVEGIPLGMDVVICGGNLNAALLKEGAKKF